MFEALLSNPEQITFTVLFVALLVYVFKSNEKREEYMQKTNEGREQNYRDTIEKLTYGLNGFQDLEKKIDDLHVRYIKSKEEQQNV